MTNQTLTGYCSITQQPFDSFSQLKHIPIAPDGRTK